MFNLTQSQLLDIAKSLTEKVYEGFKQDDQQIRCLPSYIQTNEIPKTGQALVVDFGGTNVRAAVVSIMNGKLILEKGPAKIAIPASNGDKLPRDKFLSIQSELIASLSPPDGLPLGYCFSYPSRSTQDGDSVLIKWTKELFVTDTVNRPIGSMLVDYLKKYKHPVYCSKVVVINDTIASLFAGLAENKSDGHIGLIVGTGNNMATFVNPETITKFPKLTDWHGPVPVNLESGNFWPPHLTKIDDQLDNNSDLPHEQRFEKAVSGAYLASLMKAAMPDADVDPEAGSKDVVRLATKNDSPEQSELAQAILARSAKLVAASLAGLIKILNSEKQRKHICVTAEGSLFWGYAQYETIARHTLREILDAMNFHTTNFQFKSTENANLLGSTIAALAVP